MKKDTEFYNAILQKMYFPSRSSIKKVSAYVLLFIAFSQNIYANCQIQTEKSEESMKWFQPLYNTFGRTLINQSRDFAATYKLQEIYENQDSWTSVKLNPENILNEAAIKLQKLLSSAEKTVKILAETAERLNRNSNLNERVNASILTSKKVRFYDKKPGEVSATPREVYDPKSNATLFYYNSKCVCGYQLPEALSDDRSICYTPDKAFQAQAFFDGQKVSFAFSAVHVPVDVYNAGSDVLRDIVWTQEMETTLKSQFCKNDSELPPFKWSYVSTLNGVLRYFPARPWSVPCGQVDLYDSRSTHWFVQSMTSPKEVVIMIDTSGSVIGLTLNLIRVSVDHVMNSLTVNDFFNVIVFNKEASYLNPDCPGLLPANYFNKELMVAWLEKIKVENSSSFENGFDFAFEILSQQNNSVLESEQRASCNPVILLFTDGGVTYPDEALERWNEDVDTRIFTYSVGKHFARTTELQRIACDNKGSFLSIPSDSATHFQTMKYLVKLSKPLAASGVMISKWTLPYEDHLGLNTILTVSRPFFDKYSVPTGSGHHEHIIQIAGVTGVDVLYSDVGKALDTSRWGATTYVFGTDNNGYLFFHPLLKKGRLDSPVIIDVADVELANISEIRRGMIDRRVDHLSLEKLVVSRDGRHLNRAQYNYYYSNLSQPIFSIAFVFPSTDRCHLEPPHVDTPISWNEIVVTDPDVFSAAYGLKFKQNFKSSSVCSGSGMTSDDDQTPATNMLRLTNAAETANAFATREFEDPNQARELLFHGRLTADLVNYFPSSSQAGLLASFVATDSSPSLLRVKFYVDEYLRQGIETALSDPPSKDYFLRPLLTPNADQVFVSLIDLPFSASPSMDPPISQQPITPVFDVATGTYQSTTSSDPNPEIARKHVILSEVVAINRTMTDVRPAVSGTVLRRDHVRELLFNITRSWDRLCVLLDDGGLLLVTNQDENNVGTFFGTIDGDLMKSLVRDGLYLPNNISDHQVVCESEESDGNFARSSFFTPTLVDLIKSGWWITSSFLVALQSFLSILLTSISGVLSDAASIGIPFSADESLYPNTNAKKVHCIVQSIVYEFGSRNFTVGSTDAGNRSYVASRVRNTNTMFVIASFNNSFSSPPYPPSKLNSIVTNQRKCPSGRYRRKPPERCYNVTFERSKPEHSGNADCGVGQLSSAPLLFLPIMLFVTCLIR